VSRECGPGSGHREVTLEIAKPYNRARISHGLQISRGWGRVMWHRRRRSVSFRVPGHRMCCFQEVTMRRSRYAALAVLLACGSPAVVGAQSGADAERNKQVIRQHLETMSRGEWRQAAEFFADDVRHHLGVWQTRQIAVEIGSGELTRVRGLYPRARRRSSRLPFHALSASTSGLLSGLRRERIGARPLLGSSARVHHTGTADQGA
jgi:hypothetical protein